MKERPIIFSGAMIRAILGGRKTQTRRVMNPQPIEVLSAICPYGKAGDRLWVRETWARTDYEYDGPFTNSTIYRADGEEGVYDAPGFRWKPSIHMPRAYSRVTLEIVSIRAERVQDISEPDAIAEGVDYIPEAPAALNHRTAFAGLWNSINAARGYGWDVNPWVWVIEFAHQTAAASPSSDANRD